LNLYGKQKGGRNRPKKEEFLGAFKGGDPLLLKRKKKGGPGLPHTTGPVKIKKERVEEMALGKKDQAGSKWKREGLGEGMRLSTNTPKKGGMPKKGGNFRRGGVLERDNESGKETLKEKKGGKKY